MGFVFSSDRSKSAALAPVLEMVQVTKRFGAQPVLQNVSLQVQAGETLAIIGESGCGKSVTTKLIAGFLQPDSGEVRWSGTPVQSLSAQQFRERRLRFGYLFQGAALFDSLTVYENVAFGLRQNFKYSEEEIRQKVVGCLRDVGLAESVSKKYPAELSGGMKKRVALARALVMSPDVIVYDEPTTGLDPVMSDVINELIVRTRQRQGVTSIVVTHDMHTVRRVADRVIMLYPRARLAVGESQIVFEGTVAELFSSPDVRVAEFVTGDARRRLRESAA
ncbi:MAG: ABC transporter ATP-binding protein [Planctomycetaceae bacterium]|nr:MAG: ABC transporter ATP-binding protein [Planctomycetaceae bacterium]